MTEAEFDTLLKRSLKEHFREYISEDEIDITPHEFSRGFEKKMKILIGRANKRKYISRRRIAACIAAAVIAAGLSAMSVGAVREAFLNFITEVFFTHTRVSSSTAENAPLDFSDVYEITADMSDFEPAVIREDIFSREYIYKNEHCDIYFKQYIKKYYDVALNTEGYEMEEISVNGKDGFYIDMYRHYAKSITWDNGDYILSIFVDYDEGCDFDKSRLLEIADSVRKTE